MPCYPTIDCCCLTDGCCPRKHRKKLMITLVDAFDPSDPCNISFPITWDPAYTPGTSCYAGFIGVGAWTIFGQPIIPGVCYRDFVLSCVPNTLVPGTCVYILYYKKSADPDFTACHFMGTESCSPLLLSMTNTDLPDYFSNANCGCNGVGIGSITVTQP